MSDRIERLKATVADRYRIERELGSGGMATVLISPHWSTAILSAWWSRGYPASMLPRHRGRSVSGER